MAKTKTRWICQQCGFQANGFLGRCTECGSWGSLLEELVSDAAGAATQTVLSRSHASLSGKIGRHSLPEGERASALPLSEIVASHSQRMSTGLAGVDEVLGGGLVPGSVVLLAGDPGIGKSTLLLQVARHLGLGGTLLYVAGEESAHQVSLRAERLGVSSDNILVDAGQNVVSIARTMMAGGTRVTIVDSIQSVFHPDVQSAPGSVSQVRESAQALIATAKEHGIATILVGHVTKEGAIAGPRVLEHMVDVVLYFEGDRARELRILRGVKNRFGATHEIAVFSMTGEGLREVDNPSALFLGDRLNHLGKKQSPPGTAVIAGGEGRRSLLLEVQSLVSNTAFSNARRVANGFDYNRLLQIIAVLEKKAGLFLLHCDVYVNVVGGMEFTDPSGDLGIAVAIATSLLDRSIDPGLLFLGEVGLTGEVRPVKGVLKRLKEAQKLGFKRAVVPGSNLPLDGNLDPMEVVGVETLTDALALAIPGFESVKRRSISSGADSAKGSSSEKGSYTKKHGDANDLKGSSKTGYAQGERRDLEGAFQD
ncbi:MAG: DNA repair protein RadA [Candidatus Melainabacteria bacterium]|nr:DNA repair protein RadA [Candidatus Melainabacteria bacterium]